MAVDTMAALVVHPPDDLTVALSTAALRTVARPLLVVVHLPDDHFSHCFPSVHPRMHHPYPSRPAHMTDTTYMDCTSSYPSQTFAYLAWSPPRVVAAVQAGLPVPSLLVVVPSFHLDSKLLVQVGKQGQDRVV